MPIQVLHVNAPNKPSKPFIVEVLGTRFSGMFDQGIKGHGAQFSRANYNVIGGREVLCVTFWSKTQYSRF